MSMPKQKRTIRPVSFSLTDPYEVQLLKHCNKFDHFSTYVKRLIQKDMESKKL